MNLFGKATLAAIAGILLCQLMFQPIVGLADQGDYARLLGGFHLGPTVQTPEERFYRYFNRTYQHDDNFRLPGWEVISTQGLFVDACVLIHKLVSRDGVLDIRLLSALEIVAFLGACYLILHAAARLIPGLLWTIIPVALLVIFCDVGYISYFNSFYCEPASYIFLLASVGVWLEMIAAGKARARHIVAFTICATLFVSSKPQNIAAGILLALYIWRFRLSITPRWVIPVASVVIMAASLGIYWSVPKLARLAQTYNMIFMDMLPRSADAAAELRVLGLDPAYAKYSGSGAFAPTTGFWDPAFQQQLDRNVGRFTIVNHYFTHPQQLLVYLRGVLPRGASLRAEGVGNFEKSAGHPPFARSQQFALWSRFHERYLSRWSSGILIALMLSVPLALWIAWVSTDLQQRLLAEFYAMLALSAVAEFFITVLGDAHDIAKHLHLYNVLLDICLVFTATTILIWAKQFPLRAFFRSRNKSQDRLQATQRSEARSPMAG